MRAFLGLCTAALLTGCLALSTSQPDAGSTAAATGDGGTTGETGTGGTGCGTDPETGVTLCLATNACPGMQIDPGAFPACGFRQGGASDLDLECVCAGGNLCPIGVPTSCGAVAQLLTQEQSSVQVCSQVSTGGCINLLDGGAAGSSGGGSGSSSSGSGGSTLSAACMSCISGCGGTPSCYEACGC